MSEEQQIALDHVVINLTVVTLDDGTIRIQTKEGIPFLAKAPHESGWHTVAIRELADQKSCDLVHRSFLG